MPQISIIKYSDVIEASRFDAEYFKPEYLKIEKKLINLNIKSLNDDEVSLVFDGNHLKITDSFSDDKNSIPYYRGQDVSGFFLEDVNPLRIKEETYNLGWMKRSHFKENDILLSIVGTVGNLSMVTDRISKSTGSCKLAILRPQKIKPGYLVGFLLSKYGQKQIERNTRGAVQKGLILQDFKFIKVFMPEKDFQNRLSDMILKSIEVNRKSKKLYQEAEQLLLQELGLVNYKPKHNLTFETTKKAIDQAKRLDSEYFQPKYEEIIKKIEKYEGGFDIVKNILNFNKKNFFPKKEEFYNYIPLSKVSNNGEIEIPEKELGKELPTRARRKVKKGEIILSSISGSLETSAIIEEKHENFIVSNGFYVFDSEKINPETLLMLFKSQIMIELLQRISKGAILGGYDLTTFEKIKIPLIKPQIQTKIAEKIQESHKLRKESKELLEEAKRKVEEEIEKG